jgi:acyl-CoA dehydrogenase
MSGLPVTSDPRGALFGDEHDSYRESVRTHLQRTVSAAAEAWDEAGAIPAEALQAAAEHGFLGAGVPEEHGGLGLDDVRFPAIVAEEAMRALAPAFALVVLSHDDVPVRALRAAGAEAGSRRAQWLEGLASAELRAATTLHGKVTATAGGGGGLTLDGRVDAVVGGVGAGLFVVAASTDDGPVLVAVEAGAPGVTVEPAKPPIGLRAAGLATLTFERAVVDSEARLDGADADDLLAGERLLLALASVSGARAALDLTVAYVRDRRAFGTPIATFQNTRVMLGEAAAALDGAAALADRCLQARVDGRLTAAQAAAAKLLATEVHGRVVDTGVQLHGGYGYMLEYPIAHAFADARFLRLHGGSSQALAAETAAALDLG